jgi:signal transduction histidine kinase/CheY-like chemotaxis protein
VEGFVWSDLPKLANTLAPLWVFDLDGRRIVWANAAALELWAADTVEDLLARDFSDMSQAAVTRFRVALDEVAAGKTHHEQWTLYPRGKPVTIIAGYAGVRLQDGRLGALIEAKASASVDPATLRAVEALHHTNVRVLLFTPEGRPVMQNPSAIRTFGALEEAGDAFARLFTDPAEASRARATVERGEVFSEELALATACGPRWHGLDARRVSDPVAGGALVLVNARDIEDRRAAESMSARAMASQKHFLAAMSHEIRTPLNAVIGFVDLLRGAGLGERERRFAENASLSAQHLLGLVSEVLDVSKMEAAQLQLHAEEIDLEEVLLEAVTMVSGRVRPDVELSYLLADLDCFVVGDPLRIRQIIVNLLGNAAKFTEQGFVRLHLSSARDLDASRLAVDVAVEDSGVGIPDDKLGQLFQPFKQAHGGAYGGTGLGLFLSRGLARLMGGDIEVSSTEGLGSSFSVTLVLGRGHPRGVPEALSGRRVLALTRDDELDRLFYDRFLGSGVTLVRPPSADPAGALRAALGPERVDAIILDFETFPEACAITCGLRAALPDTPLLGLSSASGPEPHDASVDATLPKPFSFHRLTKLLAELIDSPRGAGHAADLASSGMKVLVVEDVEMNVELMRELFRSSFGLDFAVASDGLDAVEKVKHGAFDLVFMDLQLPRLDGIEATRRIRALGITVPIVALTANALSEDVERARAAGMDGYLTKPVRRVDVERELRRRPRAAGAPAAIPPPPRRSSRPLGRPAAGTLRLSLRPDAAPRPEAALLPGLVARGLAPPTIVPATECPPTIPPLSERARRHFVDSFGPGRVDRLFGLASAGVRAKLADLQQARDLRSTDDMRAALHALRGILLNCGLDDLAARAGDLERAARTGHHPEAALLDALGVELGSFA